MPFTSRPPAVAGIFYPALPGPLRDDVAALLDAACPPQAGLETKALVAPHAGYIYSGPIAASAFAAIANRREQIRRVVLLGPTHRIAVSGIAVPTCEHFTTPLGNVPVDPVVTEAVVNFRQVVQSDYAHALEHSLEVELPFLQTLLGEFNLVPLAVGDVAPQAVAEVIDSLWGGDETLIVVSTDLSHYLPYEDAQHIDEETARRIVDCDPIINHYQACGATPLNALLLAARQHGLRAKRLDLRNSGDTAGDRSRVVGYGAFAFLDPAPRGHVH